MRRNLTHFASIDELHLWYYDHRGLFWILISIVILIALVGVLGNAMVIYAATQKNMSGGFRYLNEAVISLAITDFCFSLFGTPFSIVYWYCSF